MLDRALLQEHMAGLTPDQRIRLRTYIDEAEFFLELLEDDLAMLPEGSQVVELGSGCGLLSMLVASRGFRVTAFEPALSGFHEMGFLRRIVEASWVGTPPAVRWVEDVARAQNGGAGPRAAFAYSFNVLEHVEDAQEFVHGALAHLDSHGKFRIVFPNYIYPYESHFNMPTLFNKRLTELVLGKLILKQGMKDAEARLDPLALWAGLSWPTGGGIVRALKPLNVDLTFSRSATHAYLDRALTDTGFQTRKGPVLSRSITAAIPVVRECANVLNPRWLPVLDLTVRSV